MPDPFLDASGVELAAAGSPGSYASLDDNGRKARFGVSYVRSVCAQAGVGFQETSPDEDILAVDCDVKFREANVGVQVKCTSSLTIRGRSASWHLDEGWLRKWSDARLPVYFVLVIVEGDSGAWLTHRRDGTFSHAAAFWRRIVPSELASRINVPKSQRLTVETLGQWRNDMLDCFSPGGMQ